MKKALLVLFFVPLFLILACDMNTSIESFDHRLRGTWSANNYIELGLSPGTIEIDFNTIRITGFYPSPFIHPRPNSPFESFLRGEWLDGHSENSTIFIGRGDTFVPVNYVFDGASQQFMPRGLRLNFTGFAREVLLVRQEADK